MGEGLAMKKYGAWCITMGAASAAVGVAVGVGCIIIGALLISKSN